MVGAISSTELEMKLTRKLLLPTPESPINKILNDRSYDPLLCPEDDPILILPIQEIKTLYRLSLLFFSFYLVLSTLCFKTILN